MISEDQSYLTPQLKNQRAQELIKSQIKILQTNNQCLIRQIEEIKANPSFVIESIEQELKNKIKMLRRQNNSLSNTIERLRYPKIIEMTKKKTTPKISPQKMKFKTQMEEDNLLEGWDTFSGLDFDQGSMTENQKYQISTCHQCDHQENPIEALQPLSDLQLHNRTLLTAQILRIVQKTQKIKEQMNSILKQNNSNRRQSVQINLQGLKRLQLYKKKLIQILSKLKKKQRNLMKIISEYQSMHDQTLKKLQQAYQVLKELQEAEVDENIDDMYAQVVQLQERLAYINGQLQRLDQTRWLQEVYQELKKAIKKVGIELSSSHDRKSIRERIDEICQILIECNLSHEKDENQKINLLKYYQQEEKKNNKEVIQKLKTKQLTLSKSLMQLQLYQK